MPDPSTALHARAVCLMPGGVSSPVRAFRGVGGTPRYIASGHGPYLIDIAGRELIDYVMSWGPMILGHAHPEVLQAVVQAAADGFSYGAASPYEVELAEEIVDAVEAVEMVRLVNSGTEAGMAVVRLARGFTGRDHLLKFDGCYHGHADSLLVAAGSGVATFGLPDSPGVPAELAKLTHSLPYGDLAAVEATLAEYPSQVAAILVEPVAGNMGVVDPPREFLLGLRRLCDEHGTLLVFDEVMTGFRVAYAGAQSRVGIAPDLSMFGKVIGGGFPLAAYSGRAEIMNQVAPAGPIYQAGTLSGNPVAVAAGRATLDVLRNQDPYPELERRSAQLAAGLAAAAKSAGVPVTINRVGAMLTMFFADRPVRNYAEAKQADAKRFASFFHEMLERGVYLPPSQFEAWFPGTAHTDEIIERTIAIAAEAFEHCQSAGWPQPD